MSVQVAERMYRECVGSGRSPGGPAVEAQRDEDHGARQAWSTGDVSPHHEADTVARTGCLYLHHTCGQPSKGLQGNHHRYKWQFKTRCVCLSMYSRATTLYTYMKFFLHSHSHTYVCTYICSVHGYAYPSHSLY